MALYVLASTGIIGETRGNNVYKVYYEKNKPIQIAANNPKSAVVAYFPNRNVIVEKVDKEKANIVTELITGFKKTYSYYYVKER